MCGLQEGIGSLGWLLFTKNLGLDSPRGVYLDKQNKPKQTKTNKQTNQTKQKQTKTNTTTYHLPHLLKEGCLCQPTLLLLCLLGGAEGRVLQDQLASGTESSPDPSLLFRWICLPAYLKPREKKRLYSPKGALVRPPKKSLEQNEVLSNLYTFLQQTNTPKLIIVVTKETL